MYSGFNPFDCAREGLSWRLPSASSYGTDSESASLRVEENIKTRIVHGFVLDEARWRDLPQAKALVTRLLMADPRERATVYAALKSPWVVGDLYGLECAYRSRITAGKSEGD